MKTDIQKTTVIKPDKVNFALISGRKNIIRNSEIEIMNKTKLRKDVNEINRLINN